MAAIWSVGLGLLLCLALVQGQSGFRLANIYADQMVLQMGPKTAQIWGYGDPGSGVMVVVNSQMISTAVADDGTWDVRLPPMPAGGPHVLTATHGADQISINVWFGDVWVCSGQSNMRMTISQMMDPTGETDKAVTYQNIRLMKVGTTFSDTEQPELTTISTAWSAPTQQNVPSFSALCLMFAERLSDSLNNARPIGLIDTTWGGTRIEAWVSPRVTTTCNTPPNSGGNQNADHALWNSMLFPLTKMTVRGATWYQGEANAGYNRDLYTCHMQQLIEDWKLSFVDGNVPVPSENNLAFPFGIAQIGPNTGGGTNNYGYVRWHQTGDLGVLPNAVMPEAFMGAVYDTTDLDSPSGEIHPRDKPTVADRMANAAKALLYGENFHMNGPAPASVVVFPDSVIITYNMDITVQATDGFSVRQSSGTWAGTTISGWTGREVTVAVPAGATHLAYAWTGNVCDYKACAIYSADSEILPAQVWLWDLALLSNQP